MAYRLRDMALANAAGTEKQDILPTTEESARREVDDLGLRGLGVEREVVAEVDPQARCVENPPSMSVYGNNRDDRVFDEAAALSQR